MPSDLLLLLPLLGGYWFVHQNYFTRFRAQTLSGYGLVFEAALVGFGFVPPALALISVCESTRLGRRTEELWERLVGAPPGLLGVLVLALLLAPLSAWFWNVLNGYRMVSGAEGAWDDDHPSLEDALELSRIRAQEKALIRQGNHLHLLLDKAAKSQQTVSLTLQSGKVYVGWVTRSPTLKPDERYLLLLPTMSGYRDETTHEVRFNVQYPSEEYDNRKSPNDAEDFQVVLPIADIRDARLFDFGIYEQYFDAQTSPA